MVVIAGKDRGKSGTVLSAFPHTRRVVVEGVGVIKKHQKSRQRGQAGQIVDRPSPIHVSNVAIKDAKTNKPTRVGYRMEDGKKVRIAKSSNTTI